MSRHTYRLAALGGMMMVSSLAAAQSASGFYFGLGVGASDAEASTRGTPQIMTIQGGDQPLLPLQDVRVPFDATETSYGGFAGYRFTPNFAIQVGLSDLGRFEADTRALNGSRAALDILQWHALAQFSYPVASSLSLLLNGGVSVADFDLQGNVVGVRMDDGSVPFDATVHAPRGTEAALLVGAGVRWQALDALSVSLTYNHTDADTYNAGTVGVGFAWSPL